MTDPSRREPAEPVPPVRRGRPSTYRPRLNPALRRLWRGRTTLQLGVDPERAVIIHDVDTATVQFLADLDGHRTLAEALRDAARAGLPAGFLADVLAGLRRGNALLDGVEPDRPPDRLAPDRAALSLLTGGPDGPTRVSVRRAAQVVVHGTGRVGAPLAALLAAAGVGAVSVVDDGWVDATTLVPGGAETPDLHRPRRSAIHAAIRRAAPEADTGAPGPAATPTLVIFAHGQPIEPESRNALHAAGLAHLMVGLRETTAVIGPLVVPGRTSCLHCADLHRGDRDPDWPLLAMQLSAGSDRRHVPPADVALALTAAGLAGLQALSFIDGQWPAAVEGTLELAHPDWRIRRRSWPGHPRCGCRTERAGPQWLPAALD